MSDIKDQPAFPQGVSYLAGNQYTTVEPRGGMTLLDYFASMAMRELSGRVHYRGVTDISLQDASLDAYRWAEAMLAERAKRKP